MMYQKGSPAKGKPHGESHAVTAANIHQDQLIYYLQYHIAPPLLYRLRGEFVRVDQYLYTDHAVIVLHIGVTVMID